MREFFAAIILSCAIAWPALLIGGIPKPVKAQSVNLASMPKFQDRAPTAPIIPRPVKIETIKKPKVKRDKRCDGPARYEAMREAFEKGRPQPC